MENDCVDTASAYIYAELLLNIRQISFIASLPSESNETTALLVFSDRRFLSLEHNGETARLQLPAPVRDGFCPRISTRSKEISLRLPIADETATRIGPSLIDRASTFPWTALGMREDAQIACRSCQLLLVKDSVKTWKDLPSENWAEMMDFWHCHKPAAEDTPDHKATGPEKGYGAANSIGPTVGVALVDTMYIHLFRKDCNATLGNSLREPKVSLSFFFFLLS